MKVRSWAKETNMSFFIFIVYFADFTMIVLTDNEVKVLMAPLKDHSEPRELIETSTVQNITLTQVTETGETSELPPPAFEPRDAVWQPVAQTTHKCFVYSAYVERRGQDAIRIIAATKTLRPAPVFCKIWLSNKEKHITSATITTLRENSHLKYSAAYVVCKLGDVNMKANDVINATVAVISAYHPTYKHSNLLPVLDTEPKPSIEDEVHACVKPIHDSYGRVDWLVEWFEMNRLLGIKHFYMYNHSMSQNVSCLLNHYIKQGLITLLPWHLPIKSKIEIRTEGMFAAINDCLYRSMRSAAWLVVIDADELIIPRKDKTLRDLLQTERSIYPAAERTAAFLFRNVFFYTMWEDDKEATVNLITARKTRRYAVPHAMKHRSKYAVRPSLVVELGNHFVWQVVPKMVVAGVAPELGMLHHYRTKCQCDATLCTRMPSVIDRTAHRWAEELNLRVESTNHSVFKECKEI